MICFSKFATEILYQFYFFLSAIYYFLTEIVAMAALATGFATALPEWDDRSLGEPVQIESPLFASTNGISRLEDKVFDPLVIQGIEELHSSQMKALESENRILKDKDGSVTSIIVIVDPSTGKPVGSHLATTGFTGSWSPPLATFVPSSLWRKEYENITANFRFRGDSVNFNFGSSTAPNFTPWQSMGDLQADFSVFREDKSKYVAMKKQARTALGLDAFLLKFAFRIILRPISVSEGRFYLQIFPYGLDRLKQLADLWKVSSEDPHFPAILVPVSHQNKSFSHLTTFAPLEDSEFQFGVGLLPFIQFQGAMQPDVPRAWEEILMESNSLLLRFRVSTQLSIKEFAAISTAVGSTLPAVCFTGTNLIWPQMKQIRSSALQGNSFVLLCLKVMSGQSIIPIPSSTEKYSYEGAFSANVIARAYSLSDRDAETISRFCNASLAKNTWRSYKISLQVYSKFCRSALTPPSFPPSRRMILAFIAYLLRKGLKATTIRVYLSGLSKMSFTLSGQKLDLLCEVSKAAITGKLKLDPKLGAKVPITAKILKTIHSRLMLKDGVAKFTKNLMWAVCLMLFWSSCRTGEILSQAEEQFDAKTTLLNRNISFVTISLPDAPTQSLEVLQLVLESPKESRLNETVTLELFPIPNSVFCPIRAIKKYTKSSEKFFSASPDLPLFRQINGAALSHNNFNCFLRKTLVRDVDYSGCLSAHSFRAGRAAAMADAGFSAEIIKSLGRWSSEAYRHYVKNRRLNLNQSLQLHQHMSHSFSL